MIEAAFLQRGLRGEGRRHRREVADGRQGGRSFHAASAGWPECRCGNSDGVRLSGTAGRREVGNWLFQYIDKVFQYLNDLQIIFPLLMPQPGWTGIGPDLNATRAGLLKTPGALPGGAAAIVAGAPTDRSAEAAGMNGVLAEL